LCRKNYFILKKQYLIAAAIAVVMAACGQQNQTDKATPLPVNSISNNPDYQKGLELVGKSDCLGCHKVDDKVLGPSYREVAAKYDNSDATVKLLAQKIIKGGKGVWGEVYMSPHPQISEADAEQMVKYIMLLKR
jgi:cytochrome c